MVSIFVAHNLVRSILVFVTYTLFTGGKEIYIDTSISVAIDPLIAVWHASVIGSVLGNNVTEPFRSVP